MKNQEFIVFFGDASETCANSALAHDPGAFLLDQSNFKRIFNDFTFKGTVYTSLGDLSKNINEIIDLLLRADKIFYVDWNETINKNSITESARGFTHVILHLVSRYKNNVYNLELSYCNPLSYLVLSDNRKTNKRQLWVAGCSISHGTGVDPDERYGQLLSNKIDLSVSFLTHPGSSIDWAADQILRSDIQKNDIVIWGLTGEERLPLWNNNMLLHANTINCFIENIDLSKVLLSNHVYYSAYTHIYQVVNFCKKIQAKLLIFGILNSSTVSLNLNNLKNFIQYNTFNKLLDTGTDNQHPGPKQHQAYADFCHSALKKLQYI